MSDNPSTETVNRPARANYLSVSELFNLEHACRILTAAFGPCTYQVGSSLTQPDYRDVDLRCLLPDQEFYAITGGNLARVGLLDTAISEWLTARTGLPVDFQLQTIAEANAGFDGPRSFIGTPLEEAA